MSAREPAATAAATRREAKKRAALIAAYREGLGLAAIAIVRDPHATCVAALAAGQNETFPAEEAVARRWWCRRAEEATRVAASAMRRSQRRDLPGREPAAATPDVELAALIEQTAARLNVALYCDAQITGEADTAIARVEAELERLRQAGELKSVNASYRTYRLQASVRGDRALPYAEWFNTYKATLVRELANTLRQF